MKTQQKMELSAWAAMALVAAFASACGKSGSFKNKGNETAKETPRPTPVPQAKVENVEVRGYGDPNIQGQDIQFIADGKAKPLGDPIDPEENPEVTKINDGKVTNIKTVGSEVTDLKNDANCPGGFRFKDSCLQLSSVYKWNKEGSSDESRVVLSSLNEDCDTGTEPCKTLRSTGLNYRTYSKAAFRSVVEGSAKIATISDSFKGITLCHASLGTAAPESIVVGTTGCAASKETFYGFASAQSGTVPVFVWKKDGYVILSIEESKAPAEGFVKEQSGAVFYAFPPN